MNTQAEMLIKLFVPETATLEFIVFQIAWENSIEDEFVQVSSN